MCLQEVAARFLTTSRELGEAVNPTRYPTVAMIERETHFNAMNPFWQAPFAYGAGVILLVFALAFATVTGKPAPQTISRVGALRARPGGARRRHRRWRSTGFIFA